MCCQWSKARLLPTSLLSLRKIAPALRIQIEEGTRPALLGSLRQGELDCVIGRLDVGPSERDLQIVEAGAAAGSIW